MKKLSVKKPKMPKPPKLKVSFSKVSKGKKRRMSVAKALST